MVVADVSVVIPCLNCHATIDRALRSVRNQTLQPRAVIVVDDGSSTALPSLDCTVIRRDHRGAAAARNTGWRAASTKWIAFLDADDEWLPSKLEALLGLSDEHSEASVLYSDVVTVLPTGAQVAWSAHSPPHDGDILAPLLLGNFIAQPTVVVRSEALERVGGYDESFEAWEDIDLWLRLARTELFAYSDRPLVLHHIQDSGLSLNALAMAEGRLRSVGVAMAWPEVQRLPRRVRARAMALAWTQLSEAMYLAGEDRGARRSIVSAVRASPRTALGRGTKLAAKSLIPAAQRTMLRRRRAQRGPRT